MNCVWTTQAPRSSRLSTFGNSINPAGLGRNKFVSPGPLKIGLFWELINVPHSQNGPPIRMQLSSLVWDTNKIPEKNNWVADHIHAIRISMGTDSAGLLIYSVLSSTALPGLGGVYPNNPTPTVNINFIGYINVTWSSIFSYNTWERKVD